MHKSALAGLALAFATLPATADASIVLGARGFALSDDNPADQQPAAIQSNWLFGSGTVSAAADRGAGANVTARAQADPWVNKIEVRGDSSRGLQVGGALSVFAINQRVTGAPGATAHVSYSFGFDGLFTPGDPAHYPVPNPAANIPAQGLSFFLLAYRGVAQGIVSGTDQYGPHVRFVASNGEASLNRIAGAPGYVQTINPFLFPGGAAAGCFGADLRCTTGGAFNDTRTIAFDVGVDEDYYVVGFLGGQTNGTLDFFHTAKLKSLSLAPQFGLISEDGGALVRGADGNFVLAGVPEPASWGLMLAGFGLAGSSLRARRRQLTFSASA